MYENYICNNVGEKAGKQQFPLFSHFLPFQRQNHDQNKMKIPFLVMS